MPLTSDIYSQPTVFGEVLFDCFPDGRNVLGGAPFNVAWHLQGFGYSPHFISRIGNDALGQQIVTEMRHWGMETRGVQRDSAHPTGRVNISMSGTSHRFEILPDQAYDHIHAGENLEGAPPLLYHGTLVLRSGESAHSLAVLKKSGAPVFLDINLRAPWLPPDMQTLLREATWLKLNDDEFHRTTPHTTPLGQEEIQALRRRYELQVVIVTCGADGAWWCDATHCTFYRSPGVEGFVDSVGAGDAFAAVAILGLLKGWPADQLMQRAGQFAATICTIRGATTNDRLLYNRAMMSWRDDDD